MRRKINKLSDKFIRELVDCMTAHELTCTEELPQAMLWKVRVGSITALSCRSSIQRLQYRRAFGLPIHLLWANGLHYPYIERKFRQVPLGLNGGVMAALRHSERLSRAGGLARSSEPVAQRSFR
jgi:hypothetical protein